MLEDNIIEMQVRPSGQQPLTVGFNEYTCDPAHPENVYLKYRLAAGEQVSFYLVSAVPAGVYDVFFLTRDHCYAAGQGNIRVQPFPYSYAAGTLTVGNPITTQPGTTQPGTTQPGTTSTTTPPACQYAGWQYKGGQCTYSYQICTGETYYRFYADCDDAHKNPLSDPIIIAACISAATLVLITLSRK